MRIMLFSDTFPPELNGVATSTYNLYKTLKEHGHEVYVVTTNSHPTNKKVLIENGDVIRLYGIELKKLYGYRMAKFYFPSVMKFIKKFKPQVIHVQTEIGIGIFGKLVAKRLKIPLVYTYHTMYEDYTYYVTKGHRFFDFFAKKIVRSYSRIVASKATEFISPSKKTKEKFRNYGANNYINIVPTGIDFNKYKKVNSDLDAIKEYKINNNLEDTFIILSLGRIAKEKSIDVCMRGYAEYLKKDKGVKTYMLIVGGGPDLMELQLLAKDLQIEEHVKFVGPVPTEKVPFYYHLSDLFVSASITETQGLTFMEAMASETLVLARFDENLVNVIDDNNNGFFFSNADDFSNKLDSIISMDNDLKEKMKANALKTIEEYSIDKFYENIMEVYNRAIRKYW